MKIINDSNLFAHHATTAHESDLGVRATNHERTRAHSQAGEICCVYFVVCLNDLGNSWSQHIRLMDGGNSCVVLFILGA